MRYSGRSPDGDGPSIVQVVLTLGRGGLETLAADLACGLKERGLRPVVVALDEGGPLEQRLTDAKIEFAVFRGRRFRDPRFHLTFAGLLKQVRARVVHTHMFAPLLHSLPAVALAGVKRLVHTEHSYEYLEARRSLRLALRSMSHLASDFTIVGERMRAFYLDSVGVAPGKLHVIVNGIHIKPRVTAEERARTRAELGLPAGAVLVGIASRLAPEKNLELLLRAAARVGDVPLHLIMLGEGESRPALERLATHLGISESVSFLGWRDDVGRILGALDVYVLTSFSEGLPLAMLEAMAAELPVISTSVGDVPLLVREDETGFLIDQNDTDALAERLRRLALAPTLRAAMGKAGREVVLRSYDRTTMVQRYMDAYGV